MIRVLIFALTMPPSPMLYLDFETMPEAERWGAWARKTLPCHVRIS